VLQQLPPVLFSEIKGVVKQMMVTHQGGRLVREVRGPSPFLAAPVSRRLALSAGGRQILSVTVEPFANNLCLRGPNGDGGDGRSFRQAHRRCGPSSSRSSAGHLPT
jgi:hypothetical protein